RLGIVRSRATPPGVARARLRDVAGDAGQRVRDVAREEGKRAEDRDRDDGEDDAVLGHRLPVFTGKPVVELLHLKQTSMVESTRTAASFGWRCSRLIGRRTARSIPL